MAEERDDDKTEEPSQKRLDDARAKGQVALSRDVSHALILATAASLLVLALPALGPQALLALRWYLEHAAAPAGQVDEIRGHLVAAAVTLATVVAVPAAGFALAAILATVGQQGLLWSAENLHPKLERLSPLAGAKRLFGGTALVEFAKNALRLVVVGVACWLQLQGELAALVAAVGREPGGIGGEILRLLGRVALVCTLAAAGFAVLDLFWQRFRFRQRMRMSRQDLKDEMKQSEGDPIIKQRLRQIRMARSRQRMLADVPRSTVVITNPTHYAVALRYENGEQAAPLVLAKGVDHLAAAIRKAAAEHGVPVIENPPLARALHAMAEIGRPIPVEHYQAVAEVIALVMRLRRDGGRRPPG
ncbi:flagellar biosynthesis protein FlhB [Geminicoccus roseus]|uniref:flagellar biosynthesis protein FlhB n=1 Tax=Geminicoccus roseus TaxID=404900 RepID=UPI000427E34A|nr:flagellar biosynthesis protein FlhB [Geminicoccus roseus]